MEDMGESIWSDNIGCCTYSGVVMVDGSEVAKMNKTFRQYAIDYIQNRHLCKGYVDYIVAELNKLDKIEQIVSEWNNDASHSFSDMCKINGILKE